MLDFDNVPVPPNFLEDVQRKRTKMKPEKRPKLSEEQSARNAFYKDIEEKVSKYMQENGGSRLHSHGRIKQHIEGKGGITEWYYLTADLIHKAFTKINSEYVGGKIYLRTTNKLEKTPALENKFVGHIDYDLTNQK